MYCFFVYDRQRAGEAHTNGTDVYIGACLIRIIQRVAKHLCLRFELRMDFKANGRDVGFHSKDYTKLLRPKKGDELVPCLFEKGIINNRDSASFDFLLCKYFFKVSKFLCRF